MERYWTLKYIQQQGLTELEATVFKEGLARADALPLVLPVLGTGDLPRGARVRVRLGAIDLITLDVNGTVIERLDTAAEAAVSAEDDTEEETVAGPIAIAVDVTDTPEEEAGAAPAAADQ
jgi:exoribonuclease II